MTKTPENTYAAPENTKLYETLQSCLLSTAHGYKQLWDNELERRLHELASLGRAHDEDTDEHTGGHEHTDEHTELPKFNKSKPIVRGQRDSLVHATDADEIENDVDDAKFHAEKRGPRAPASSVDFTAKTSA